MSCIFNVFPKVNHIRIFMRINVWNVTFQHNKKYNSIKILSRFSSGWNKNIYLILPFFLRYRSTLSKIICKGFPQYGFFYATT